MCKLYSSNLQVYNHYFFKNFFYYFSLSFPSNVAIIRVLVGPMVLHISKSRSILFVIFACSSGCIILIFDYFQVY